MALTCGIVGLPNVGKSTTFNALTKAGAKVENYPFCTIEPNSGVVEVPDDRLQKISELITTEKVIPTTVEFLDIAGLVKGASKGEGLGNQFLGNIRNTDVIVHVVRCFENGDIIHVDNSVDAIRDIETIETELMLADLDVVDKRIVTLQKQVRAGVKEAKSESDVLTKISACLSDGKMVSSLSLDEDEKAELQIGLITLKPVLYCCNVNEDDVIEGNEQVKKVQALGAERNSEVVFLCAAIESEIVELESEEERKEFLDSLGLAKSGLEVLSQKSYTLLGLSTYFTAGEKEVRAWTIKNGASAPEAAGVIHSDFEKGFIRAEAYHFDDLMELKSEKQIKSSGRLRVEGKDYTVVDGDIMHFLFN